MRMASTPGWPSFTPENPCDASPRQTSLTCGSFGDHFGVDAERGAVFDFDLDPGIDPGLGQSRMDRGGLVE